MKKKIISLIMIVAVLASCIIPASAAASSNGQRTKDVTAYVFSMDDSKKLTCLFTDQLPSVPYIEVTDYLNTIYKIPFTAEKNAETSDGWFVGFAQMDGRTVVVAIVLEDSGSGVAAGRAHDVFLAALDTLAHR